MDLQGLLNAVGEALTVGRVFGDPYQENGMTIIPVAYVRGGAGGGEGEQGGRRRRGRLRPDGSTGRSVRRLRHRRGLEAGRRRQPDRGRGSDRGRRCVVDDPQLLENAGRDVTVTNRRSVQPRDGAVEEGRPIYPPGEEQDRRPPVRRARRASQTRRAATTRARPPIMAMGSPQNNIERSGAPAVPMTMSHRYHLRTQTPPTLEPPRPGSPVHRGDVSCHSKDR